MEKQYAKSIWFNKPNSHAPEFVIGNISISKDNFIEWLKNQEPNEKGYIYLSVLDGKNKKEPYITVDNYKK